MFEQFETQLDEVIRYLGVYSAMFGLDYAVIGDALSNHRINDKTDNLILAAITWHALNHSSVTKAFLSENKKDFGENAEAKSALDGAGIKYFGKAQACFAWLSSLGSQPVPE